MAGAVVAPPGPVAEEVLRQARLGVRDERGHGMGYVVDDGDAAALGTVVAEDGDVVFPAVGRLGLPVEDLVAGAEHGRVAVGGGAEVLGVVVFEGQVVGRVAGFAAESLGPAQIGRRAG